MRYLGSCGLLAVALILAPPARADDGLNRMSEALRFVYGTGRPPGQMLWGHAVWINVALLRELGGIGTREAPAPVLERLPRNLVAEVIAPLRDGEGWRSRTGVEPATLDDALQADGTTAGGRLTVLGLRDTAIAAAVFAALPGQAFTPNPDDARLLQNGTPGRVALNRRDPFDPWRGPSGISYLVFVADRFVVRANAPTAAIEALQARPLEGRLNTALSLAIMGVRGAGAGAGTVLSAALILESFGLRGAYDPLDGGATQEEASVGERYRRWRALRGTGVPPFLAGLILDVREDSGWSFVVSLAYPDCDAATFAADAMERRWQSVATGQDRRSLADGQPGAAPKKAVVRNPRGQGCAAVLRVAEPAAVPANGSAFQRLLGNGQPPPHHLLGIE